MGASRTDRSNVVLAGGTSCWLFLEPACSRGGWVMDKAHRPGMGIGARSLGLLGGLCSMCVLLSCGGCYLGKHERSSGAVLNAVIATAGLWIATGSASGGGGMPKHPRSRGSHPRRWRPGGEGGRTRRRRRRFHADRRQPCVMSALATQRLALAQGTCALREAGPQGLSAARDAPPRRPRPAVLTDGTCHPQLRCSLASRCGPRARPAQTRTSSDAASAGEDR